MSDGAKGATPGEGRSPDGGGGAVDDEAIDPLLLQILVCPRTKQSLVYDAEAKELVSPAARLAYPIRAGVPIMLIDEARPLSDAEFDAPRKRG